ncbi:MAG: cytochrome b N-terminal domain-containing protein [Gemmatimonadaceae bacterium]
MRHAERAVRRGLRVLDALCARLYGVAWNPIHQSGTVAVAMLLVLIGTGLYLVLFYRVGSPAESVARIAADPYLGSWMRSLHRYSSDLFIVAAAVHMLRMFAQSRSWGPRTMAWISGLTLLGAGIVCAWTGFVMAWDSFGERLARDGARLLDALPIFSEPLSRIFAGDRPVPSAFFFVNLFAHIGIPLAMGVILWVHVSKVARPVLLPPKRLTWSIIGALTVLSIILPAELGPPANALLVRPSTPMNLFAAWWLPVSERLSPATAWGSMIAAAILLASVPLLTRRRREGPLAASVVDPRLCTGCNQCPQDCPWEAITMVERDDDRPTLVALVDPARCVSCGICAGSCAPMGVGPPGRTGRDQLASLREELVTLRETQPVVAICCSQAPVSHVDALRVRGAHVRPVSCVGNLHSSVVELLIRDGVPGVIVCGCPPRDCLSREGPKWLNERLFNEREAELRERVDRRRVRVATLAPGDLSGTVAAYEAFARHLSALDAPVGEPAVEIDLICDPVPIEADA